MVSHVGNSAVVATAGTAPGAVTPHADTKVGDLVLFYFYAKINTNGNQAVTLPTGFTSIVNARTANGLLAIGWRVRAGGDTTHNTTLGGTYATGNSGDTIQQWTETYHGQHASTPIGAVGALTDLASSLSMGSIPAPSGGAVLPSGGLYIVAGGREENVTGQTLLTGDGLRWTATTRFDSTLGADQGVVTQRGANIDSTAVTPTAKTITTTGTAATGRGVSFIIEPKAGPTFPEVSTLLDDFNRADAQPPGGDWATTMITGTGATGLKVLSNTLGAVSGSSAHLLTTRGPDVELYCDVSTMSASGSFELWGRVTDPGTTVYDGYQFVFNPFDSTSSTNLTIGSYVNNVPTALFTGQMPGLVNGDGIGFKIVGSTLTMLFRPGASGPWHMVAQITNTTHTSSGKMGVALSGVIERIDNLKGGTISSGPQTYFRTLSVAQVGAVGAVRNVNASRVASSVVLASTTKRAESRSFATTQSLIASTVAARLFLVALASTEPLTASVRRSLNANRSVAQATSIASIKRTYMDNVAAVAPSSASSRRALMKLYAAQTAEVPWLAKRTNKSINKIAADYPNVVLADSPLLYWREGETSGTSAADSSGNGRTATYGAGVTLGVTGSLVGDSNTAIEYSAAGTASIRQSAGTTVIPAGSQRTFTGLAYRVVGGTGSLQIIDFGGGALRSFGSGQHVYFGQYGNEDGWSDAITRGVWFHWALTFDASTDVAELFIDGDSLGTRNIPSDLFAGSTTVGQGPMQYGGGGPGFEEAGNRTDEFAVFSGILSPARIAAQAEAAVTAPAGGQAITSTIQRQPRPVEGATQSTLGTLSRRSNSVRTASIGSLGFLAKLLSRTTTAAQGESATATPQRAFLRTLSAVATSSATVARIATRLRAVTALAPSSAALTRRTNRAPAAASPEVATLTRRTNRSTAATSPVVATLVSIRAFLKTLTATLASTGSVRRAITTARAASAPSTAFLARSPRPTRSATAPEAATLRRAVARSTAAVAPATATIIRANAYLRTLAATASSAASAAKQARTQTSTVAPISASARRDVQARRTVTQGTAAFVTRQLALLRTVAATTVQAASVRRSTSRSTSAEQPESGAVTRYTEQRLTAPAPSAGLIRRSLTRTFNATVGSLATWMYGGLIPHLVFPLRVRVQEFITEFKALEGESLTVRVREAIASARASEPEATVVASEPEASVQADESGSTLVRVNEEGPDN